MNKVSHGTTLPIESRMYSAIRPNRLISDNASKYEAPFWPFGYMFRDLQHNPENLLEESPNTVSNLRRLGKDGMQDPTKDKVPGVSVPAIYTFFGQFVDHDITKETGSSRIGLRNPYPIELDQITAHIVNSRSPNLDLDPVYGPNVDGELAPRDPNDENKLLIESVGPGILGPTSVTDSLRDLPREQDGSARIGDKRNDENIVISQLHVAFLRAHNHLVTDHKLNFADARKVLTQHYQWIVLNDFLGRIVDPRVLDKIRKCGPRFFNPPTQTFVMPLEFSVAAYRFGHSKVRPSYDGFNSKHEGGGLDLLFSNARQRLPEDWVIDWNAFLSPEKGVNLPRPIDTSMNYLLLGLDPKQLDDDDKETNLAIRNLLRGYILRIPTGQAVAKAMASELIVPLTPDQITSVAKRVRYQNKILEETDFLTRTPLWFYILAEAGYYSGGYHLGPVGSTIVAEVLIGVLRNSTDSILAEPHWRPTLGSTPGRFELKDLLKLAGVL